MKYELSEIDISVIKSSLNAHLHQCEEFIKLDNQVKTFTTSERIKVEEKIKCIKELLNRL